MISQEKINEIIDRTDIVALVSEHVTLQKRGKNYFGLCPFHDDQSPSFSVSPSKKIAKCMSCGEGGNPINFLKKIKNCSFDEAAYYLADKVGVHLEKTKSVQKTDENQKYYEINQVAQQFYEHFLHNTQSGKEALEYLYKRGLNMETIKMFGIGLAPKNHTTLTKVLNDKGYSLIDATDIGLLRSNKEGYYDTFSSRIMFPICDEAGRVLGFSGRIYVNDPNQPKYVNTEETVIYKKGEMLYNLNNAVPHIRKMGRVILCEGQMDVIALTNAGVKEVVCSLGTALTSEQALLLSKYTKNILICYDGDAAGIKATGKAFNVLKTFNAHSITLPNKMDPDEYIKSNGKDSFLDYLSNNQKDLYAFLYSNAFVNRNLNIAYDYEEVKKSVFDLLLKTGSKSLIEKYLRQLAVDLKVSYDAIYNDYNIYSKQLPGQKNVEVLPEEDNISLVIKPHEKAFLNFIFSERKYMDYFNAELGEIGLYIENRLVKDYYMAVRYFYNSTSNAQKDIFNFITNSIKNDYIYEIMRGVTELFSMDDDIVDRLLNDCIEKFQKVKYLQIRSGYEVNSNNATDDVLNTLNEKLAFVRQNVSKKRK